MFRTIGLAFAATAITVTPATTAIAGGDSSPPAGSAFLSPAAAKASLGPWGLGHWDRVDGVPSGLRFDDSCAPGLAPKSASQVLRDREHPHLAEASIRSLIKSFDRASAAKRVKIDRAEQTRDCINDLPARDRLVRGMKVTTHSGAARVFGADLGTGRASSKLEYIVVGRSGKAVELTAFHVYAQDTLSRSTLQDLAERMLHRLHHAA
jgi:hypothetical protein